MQRDYRILGLELLRKCKSRNYELSHFTKSHRRFFAASLMLDRERGAHPKRFWWLSKRSWALRFKRGVRERILLREYSRVLFEERVVSGKTMIRGLASQARDNKRLSK